MFQCLFFACVYYPKIAVNIYTYIIYTHLIWLCLGSRRIGIHILVFMTSTSLSVTFLPCFHILIIPHNPTPDELEQNDKKHHVLLPIPGSGPTHISQWLSLISPSPILEYIDFQTYVG